VDLNQAHGDKKFKGIWPGRDMDCQVLIWRALFCMGMALFVLQGQLVHAGPGLFAFALAVLLPPLMAVLLFYPEKKWGQTSRHPAALGSFSINLSMCLFLSIIILDRL